MSRSFSVTDKNHLKPSIWSRILRPLGVGALINGIKIKFSITIIIIIIVANIDTCETKNSNNNVIAEILKPKNNILVFDLKYLFFFLRLNCQPEFF